MTTYKLTPIAGIIEALPSHEQFPSAPDNADYQAYLAWLALGNVPDPADPLPPLTQDQIDVIAALADPKVQVLIGQTPAAARAWILANVTSIPDLKDFLGTLASVVCILGRRL